MVEASAAVLEAATTASRASSLGKTDPDRIGRADEARRKLTADFADYADALQTAVDFFHDLEKTQTYLPKRIGAER
jgi:hypothetical protein